MPELFQRLRPIDTDGRLTAIHARSVYLPKFLQGQHGEISSEKILTLLEEFYEQSWQEQKGFGLLTDEEKAVPLFTPSEFYQWLLQSAFKEEQAIVPDHERQKYAEKLHIAQSNLQEESLTFEEIVRRARRTRDAQALFGGFSVVHTDESDLDPDDDIPEPQITDENRHLFLPTDIPPGSSKQDIFRARFLNGLPLWHPEDAKETISEADAAEGNRRYEERQARKRASDTSPHDDVD